MPAPSTSPPGRPGAPGCRWTRRPARPWPGSPGRRRGLASRRGFGEKCSTIVCWDAGGEIADHSADRRRQDRVSDDDRQPAARRAVCPTLAGGQARLGGRIEDRGRHGGHRGWVLGPGTGPESAGRRARGHGGGVSEPGRRRPGVRPGRRICARRRALRPAGWGRGTRPSGPARWWRAARVLVPLETQSPTGGRCCVSPSERWRWPRYARPERMGGPWIPNGWPRASAGTCRPRCSSRVTGSGAGRAADLRRMPGGRCMLRVCPGQPDRSGVWGGGSERERRRILRSRRSGPRRARALAPSSPGNPELQPVTGRVLASAVNVSEGRDPAVLDRARRACGDVLLDVHRDRDHHRSVFTLGGPGPACSRRSTRWSRQAVDSLDSPDTPAPTPDSASWTSCRSPRSARATSRPAMEARDRPPSGRREPRDPLLPLRPDARRRVRSLPEVRRGAFALMPPTRARPAPRRQGRSRSAPAAPRRLQPVAEGVSSSPTPGRWRLRIRGRRVRASGFAGRGGRCRATSSTPGVGPAEAYDLVRRRSRRAGASRGPNWSGWSPTAGLAAMPGPGGPSWVSRPTTASRRGWANARSGSVV